jgi:hypothetical protein
MWTLDVYLGNMDPKFPGHHMLKENEWQQEEKGGRTRTGQAMAYWQ